MRDKKILDLTKFSIRNVRLCSAGLGFILAIFLINPIKKEFITYLNSVEVEIVLIILLVFMFNSRSYGTIIDIRTIQRNFVNSHFNNFPKRGWLPFFIFGAIYLALIFSTNNISLFTSLLILFWLYNILFWKFFSKDMATFHKNNYKEFIKDDSFIDKEKIRICWKYYVNNFKWNKTRHITLFCFLILALILRLTELDIKIETIFSIHNNGLLVSSILITAVIFGETFIWVKRIKMKYQIKYIEEIGVRHKYK